MNPVKPIFFLHIPKTGGVSLRTIVSCHFAPEEIFHVPDHESRNATLAADVARRFGYVHGHFDCLFVEPILDQIDLMTFLRDPVSRICSIYGFFRRQPRDIPADAVTLRRIEYAHALSLADFIEVEDPIISGMINSGQRATLGGSFDASLSTFARAQALLERSAFFGLCERFEESIELLAHTMGWPSDSAPPQLNSSVAGTRPNKVSREIRDRIREKNQADIQLYEIASALFEDRRQKMAAQQLPWRRRIRNPQRYLGRQTAAGQIINVARPLLGSGWLNLEGAETGRPWRFAGPGSESTLYCVLEPESGAELWVMCHLPFFVPGLAAKDIHVRLNGHPCHTGCFEVAQGAILWIRAESRLLEDDGIQCMVFESKSPALELPPTQPNAGDDRPIRFALTQVLCMQFDAKAHARFAGRLARLLEAMTSPELAAPLREIAIGMAAQIATEHLLQPALSTGVAWCTPLYQHRRLLLLEASLTNELPRDAITCLHQLYSSDPALLGEILFLFYPHIAPVRAGNPA